MTRKTTARRPPPRATYRVQLGPSCTFADVTALIPYLSALGVSHVYCSPYLRARPGSLHGYDIVDHNAWNPEIGDACSFEAFVAALRAHGMGHVLDFVPNHMGIAHADNAWWLDVLEWGQESAAAPFFDIDWTPGKLELHGKVLVPFLGDHYGRVLERGELKLRFEPETGTFSVWYHDHRFPIAPAQYARILGPPERLPVLASSPNRRALSELMTRARELSGGRRAETRPPVEHAAAVKADLARLCAAEPALLRAIEARVARINGVPEHPATFRGLHRLLEAQHYRLAFWRVAADEVNYRRFFNVNELAGVRVEQPLLFDTIHRLVFRLVREGTLDGLRIDHVDGLFDPGAYCDRLRKAVGEDAWIVVEKILAPHERLCREWPVAGTTGYDFLAQVNGIFVDPTGEPRLTALHREIAEGPTNFADVAYLCKKYVMNFLLASELQVLATDLDRVSERDWRWRDFTATSLREALKEVVACLPVYRTYLDAGGAGETDRREIAHAVAEARRRSSDPEPSLFDFVARVATADEGADLRTGEPCADVLELARRLQQFTGPVAAKGVEDTACYRYHRLLSLNEVGDDPRRFGISVDEFHARNRERAATYPHGMITTSTHDTKRGEDVRARVNVLSEISDEWGDRVRTWMRLAAPARRMVEGEVVPTAAEQYYLYQTLIGSWPAELTGVDRLEPTALAAYRDRITAHVVKALREAKERTSWRHPRPDHEAAVVDFVRTLLDGDRHRSLFLEDFLPFQQRVAVAGAVNGLAQLLLKLTAPGVPDVYQGAETWDLSLVDPDNRRAVDYADRARLLERVRAGFGEVAHLGHGELRELLDGWRDGAVKMLLLWRLLALRRDDPALFADGDYQPLGALGREAGRVCTFARCRGARALVVVAPRLIAPLLTAARPAFEVGVWGDTAVSLAPLDAAPAYRDVLTGAVAVPEERDGGRVLPVAPLLGRFPGAALLAMAGPAS